MQALKEEGARTALESLAAIETNARENVVPAIQEQLRIGERTVKQIEGLRDNANSVTVSHLSAGEYQSSNEYEEDISLDIRSLLFISAHGIASRSGGKVEAEAGLNIVIKIDNKWCSADQNYERSSIRNSFYAAASCIALLEPGIHEVHVERRDYTGNKTDQSLYVTTAAIAAFEE